MRINKRIGALLFAVLLLCLQFNTASASSNAIQVYINGKLQSFGQAPFSQKGTTLVPMRAIFEALGAKVTWDSKNQIIDAQKGDTYIRLQIGWSHAWIGQTQANLDVAPQIIKGSVYVPLRFVGQALGSTVTWDSKTNSIKIMASGSAAGGTSSGTLGEGLASFASSTGLSITNWSVKLDKLGDKQNYIVTITGKLTNKNKTAKTLNWGWFLIQKPGQNTILPIEQTVLGSADFSLLPGNSADFNLSYGLPRGESPSNFKMVVKLNDGSLLTVSSLGGYSDITDYSILTDSTYTYGRTGGFQQAIADDFFTAVDWFLAHGKSVKDVDDEGYPVIKYAIDSDDPDMVEYMAKAGADLNQAIDGQLPYQYAWQRGSIGILQILQKYGAKQSGDAEGAYTGEGGLVKAAAEDKANIVQQLLDSGVNPDAMPDGSTALMIAAENGFDDVVKILLTKNANTEIVSNTQPGDGYDLHWTALMNAAYKGKSSTVQLLIDAKANLDAQDATGETPLMIAAEYQRTDKVQVLLAAGANVNITDKQGKTALQYAQSNGNTDIINLLKQAGAN